MDADQIFVMGEGLVLEQGTHQELISKQGAYAKLVQAQKLRESDTKYTKAKPVEDEVEKEKAEIEQAALKRTETSRSLASEILKRRAAEKDTTEKEYTLYYLLKRLAFINRESWTLYYWCILGAIVSGMGYPILGLVYGVLLVKTVFLRLTLL